MSMNCDGLLEFLRKLTEKKIFFTLHQNRGEGISVHIVVPGERWEVDYLEDGSIDVEIFRGGGELLDESALSVLFAKYSD